MIQRAPWQPATEVLNSDDGFFFTQHFGLRGCREHHDMFVEDFSFSKDDNGVEYVTYEENPTIGTLSRDDEDVDENGT